MDTRSKKWDSFCNFFFSKKTKAVLLLLLASSLFLICFLYTRLTALGGGPPFDPPEFRDSPEYAENLLDAVESAVYITKYLSGSDRSPSSLAAAPLLAEGWLDKEGNIICSPEHFTIVVVTGDGTVYDSGIMTTASFSEYAAVHVFPDPYECDFFYSCKHSEIEELFDLTVDGVNQCNFGNFSIYDSTVTSQFFVTEPEVAVFITADPLWIQNQTIPYEEYRLDVLRSLFGILILCTVPAAAFLILAATAGKQEAGVRPRAHPLDLFSSEILTAVFWFLSGFLLWMHRCASRCYLYLSSLFGDSIGLILTAAAPALAIFLLCIIVLLLMRKIRCHVFFRSFLLLRGILWLYKKYASCIENTVRRASRKNPNGARFITLYTLLQAAFLLVFFLCYMMGSSRFFPVFALLLTASLLGWLICTVRLLLAAEDLDRTEDAVTAIAGGSYNTKISLPERSPFRATATGLEGIGAVFSNSVEEQVKAERMKVDLISNVSHDLKTPLTSIIGYIDLLEKEDLPPSAADYVKVLRRRADRFKDMVQDLFVLAKSTSGSDTQEAERLDLNILLQQVVGDMDDRIRSCASPLVTNYCDEPLPVTGDGAKLYRVFQNLLDNALKYALPGTRIFLRSDIEDGWAAVRLQNVSSYEIGFTAEEITERFVRGDRSRSTEGNGLGLAIAKSFTERQGGLFTVCTDGDVFKVSVSLPLAPGTDKL